MSGNLKVWLFVFLLVLYLSWFLRRNVCAGWVNWEQCQKINVAKSHKYLKFSSMFSYGGFEYNSCVIVLMVYVMHSACHGVCLLACQQFVLGRIDWVSPSLSLSFIFPCFSFVFSNDILNVNLLFTVFKNVLFLVLLCIIIKIFFITRWLCMNIAGLSTNHFQDQ